jgi:hypothetical protein
MKAIVLVSIIPFIFIAPWFFNAYKLTTCDFDAPYKCEVIHGIGLFIPPTSLITAWFDSDS